MSYPEVCEHKNLHSNIGNYIPCPTPYCSGSEFFCLDCRRYITECGCGYNNGVSGWTFERWRKYWDKKSHLIVKTLD